MRRLCCVCSYQVFTQNERGAMKDGFLPAIKRPDGLPLLSVVDLYLQFEIDEKRSKNEQH
jgi:hypothetical protein